MFSVASARSLRGSRWRGVPRHLLGGFAFGPLLLAALSVAAAQESLQLQRQDQQLLQATAYAPASSVCAGVAIVSPGAGGSEKGYAYLAEALSSQGYLAVVVGHPESGRKALRGLVRSEGLRDGLAELITEPAAYRGRLMDIAAARQWAKGRCKSEMSVLVGHSMGAATTLMEAGAKNKLGIEGSDAFGAYIALSPQGAGSIFPDKAWSDIKKPVLMLTGTRDTELGGASWETRTEPFHNMPNGCKWLAVIDGASHLNFAGSGASRRTEALTTKTVAAYLDGLHKSDCSAPPATRGMELKTK